MGLAVKGPHRRSDGATPSHQTMGQASHRTSVHFPSQLVRRLSYCAERVRARIFRLYNPVNIHGADDGITARIVSHRDAFRVRGKTDQRHSLMGKVWRTAGSQILDECENVG